MFPIQLVTGDFLLEQNRPGRVFDQSPPSTARLRISGSIPLLPQISLHVMDTDTLIVYYMDINTGSIYKFTNNQDFG
jgi:hypothetical protein